MTISSSLNAGVAGLSANASRLASIADNIANSATFGYRRSITNFHSMVINSNVPGSYSAGGVRATAMRLIDEQGPLISTSNSTDIAISGRGFLPVTPASSLNNTGTPPLQLMTTGSFRPTLSGILSTDNGMVLMGWPANNDGSMPAYPRDTNAGLQPVQINMNQFTSNPTTRISLGLNLPATATRAGEDGSAHTLAVEYFSNLGTSETLNLRFTPLVPATGTSNQWLMQITDPADGDILLGEYEITFDDAAATGGRILSVTQPVGAPGLAYDPVAGSFAVTVGGNPVSFQIGRPGVSGGLSQLADSFTPVSISKDGSPVGSLVGIEVDSNGFLHAVYNGGYTRLIYQIPLVDVPNPNGLESLNNQAYRVSASSGAFFLWNAGDGPTGEMIGYAREESATDVAAELTQMIQTQRAYSSNAKVIQTSDEMLQETTNIKR